MSRSADIAIYQLRIRLKSMSPMIVRTLLVKDTTSITDLHHYIQILMRWRNERLHRFTIRAASYQDSDRLLKDFQFHVGEKFLYEYNFVSSPWQNEIRLEKILPLHPKKTYPFCLNSRGRSLPEECDGPYDFMALEEQFQSGVMVENIMAESDYDREEDDRDDDSDEERDIEEPETIEDKLYRLRCLFADIVPDGQMTWGDLYARMFAIIPEDTLRLICDKQKQNQWKDVYDTCTLEALQDVMDAYEAWDESACFDRHAINQQLQAYQQPGGYHDTVS